MKKFIIGTVAIAGLVLGMAPAQATAACLVPAVPAAACVPVAPGCALVAPVVTYGHRGWYRGGYRVHSGRGYRIHRGGYRAHFHGHFHRR